MEKSKVLETLQQLPDTFETDVLIDKLLIIEKIEKGLKDVKEGKTYSLEESKSRASKWLQ
jgi:hypothetical protein